MISEEADSAEKNNPMYDIALENNIETTPLWETDAETLFNYYWWKSPATEIDNDRVIQI